MIGDSGHKLDGIARFWRRHSDYDEDGLGSNNAELCAAPPRAPLVRII